MVRGVSFSLDTFWAFFHTPLALEIIASTIDNLVEQIKKISHKRRTRRN